MYIKCYDMAHDDFFQCIIDDNAIVPTDIETSAIPFPNIPIKSRLNSERYPEKEDN